MGWLLRLVTGGPTGKGAPTVQEFLMINFYSAMYFSAKRGIAIACRLSVRLSVRPSVCNVGEL